LRTPLTSLRLTLEMELAQPRADASIAVNEALADVDRLEATLTNLLALARDVPDDRGPLAVTHLLQDARARWSRPLAAEGRSIVTETADATPVVHASATALATVIDVLVDNALHHGRGTVVVAARPARPMGVSITVADEGALTGDANSVFDRRASEGGGHGIGLALARSLAHAEGCRLRLVQPAPTTFELLVVEPASRSAPEIAVR
jgi:signal transduction histidine kinase